MWWIERQPLVAFAEFILQNGQSHACFDCRGHVFRRVFEQTIQRAQIDRRNFSIARVCAGEEIAEICDIGRFQIHFELTQRRKDAKTQGKLKLCVSAPSCLCVEFLNLIMPQFVSSRQNLRNVSSRETYCSDIYASQVR